MICNREKCCHKCWYADDAICEFAGEVSCSDLAKRCKHYKLYKYINL